MRQARLICFLLILIIEFSAVCSVASPIVLNTDKVNFFITGDFSSFYFTNNKNVSPHEILNLFRNNKFRPFNADVLNAGIANQYYWIHFSIFNKDYAEKRQLVEIPNPRLNNLELFEVDDSIIKSIGQLGDFQPFHQRKVNFKNFLFITRVEKGKTKDYFLFVDQIGHSCTVPIVVYNEKYLLNNIEKNYLFDGIVYGLLLFVSITSMLFFISTTKKKTEKKTEYFYLYYSLYILTGIFWVFSYFGLGFQYLWPGVPEVNTAAPLFFSCFNILLNVQICQVLLQIKERNKVLYKTGNISKILLALFGVFPLVINLNERGYAINHSYLVAFLSLIIVSVLIIFTSVCSYSFKGVLEAKLYLSASFLKVLSIINLALLELGITPAIPYVEIVLQIGLIVEITLLTFALGRRYSIIKFRSYELVVEAQENERYAISQEIHDGIAGNLIAARNKLSAILLNASIINSTQSEDMKKTVDIINHALSDARSISHNIPPGYLRDHTLCESINEYIKLVQNKCQPGNSGRTLKITCISSNIQEPFLDLNKLNIYRIVQEAITNTIKHSNACLASLFLLSEKNEFHILFTDNGIGITTDVNNNEMSFAHLKSRVKILEGEFKVVTAIPNVFQKIILEYNPKSLIYVKVPLKMNIFENKGLDL